MRPGVVGGKCLKTDFTAEGQARALGTARRRAGWPGRVFVVKNP